MQVWQNFRAIVCHMYVVTLVSVLLLIVTYLLSCIISKLWPIIGQFLLLIEGCLTLMPPLGMICKYPDKLYLSKFG